MNTLLIVATFISTITVTSYQSLPSQTDSSPWTTSIGERVTIRGCAVSQDLLEVNGGKLNYGDLIYIDEIGFKFVNDAMNKRWKNKVDIWVASRKDEILFDKKFRNKNLKIWKIIRWKK